MSVKTSKRMNREDYIDSTQRYGMKLRLRDLFVLTLPVMQRFHSSFRGILYPERRLNWKYYFFNFTFLKPSPLLPFAHP